MISAINVVNPDDLSLGVDAFWFGALAAWRVDRREGAATIEEALLMVAATVVLHLQLQ